MILGDIWSPQIAASCVLNYKHFINDMTSRCWSRREADTENAAAPHVNKKTSSHGSEKEDFAGIRKNTNQVVVTSGF